MHIWGHPGLTAIYAVDAWNASVNVTVHAVNASLSVPLCLCASLLRDVQHRDTEAQRDGSSIMGGLTGR